ncbi:MAG: dihydroorotate dehydrogenase [Candidatus Cloacimonetes bacterium]|nr:dihydroorotate dehydrogenase [Candidatus Cloacimonadota bacterium]
MNRLSTKLGRIELANPVTVASGTFGLESGDWYDLSRLGALVSKTITLEPRAGNQPPRLFETSGGLLNSIGLQNPGLEAFLRDELPLYAAVGPPLMVSFSAGTVDEFCRMVETMEKHEGIAGYEVNVSCPNVEREGMAFGTDAQVVYDLTRRLAALTQRELCVKLTPNVTDIVTIARAAQEGGATSLALINTLLGMAIDPETGHSRIARGVAGYSGPAIKPVAVACVWRVAQAVNIPILAMGGIAGWEDAVELIRAGACAVAVGTAAFVSPDLPVRVLDGLDAFLARKELTLAELVGTATF